LRRTWTWCERICARLVKKEFQHLCSIRRLAQNRFPVIILSANLKNGFRQINGNGTRLHGERSFSLRGETTPDVGGLLPI
jgi:hypothetical protein